MAATTAPIESSVVSTRDTSVFKPALLLMSGRTIAFAATFFIPLVLARVFDVAQFGTYKQLFLVWGTVYAVAQLGMASSLYYFLPRAPLEGGRYAANSLLFLAAAGLSCFAAVTLGAPQVSRWLSNNALAAYLPWIGLYIGLTMFVNALEIVLISRGRYLWASASYALSDLVRAGVFIIPALLFHRLDLLLKGAVLLAVLRSVVMLVYFRKEFAGSFRPDAARFREQMAYALPVRTRRTGRDCAGKPAPIRGVAPLRPRNLRHFRGRLPADPAGRFRGLADQRRDDGQNAGEPLRGPQGRGPWNLARHHVEAGPALRPAGCLLVVNAREIIVLLYTTRYAAERADLHGVGGDDPAHYIPGGWRAPGVRQTRYLLL